jgi:hypothetical protein
VQRYFDLGRTEECGAISTSAGPKSAALFRSWPDRRVRRHFDLGRTEKCTRHFDLGRTEKCAHYFDLAPTEKCSAMSTSLRPKRASLFRPRPTEPCGAILTSRRTHVAGGEAAAAKPLGVVPGGGGSPPRDSLFHFETATKESITSAENQANAETVLSETEEARDGVTSEIEALSMYRGASHTPTQKAEKVTKAQKAESAGKMPSAKRTRRQQVPEACNVPQEGGSASSGLGGASITSSPGAEVSGNTDDCRFAEPDSVMASPPAFLDMSSMTQPDDFTMDNHFPSAQDQMLARTCGRVQRYFDLGRTEECSAIST